MFARGELLILNKSGGTHIGARQLSIGFQSEVRWRANNQLAGANMTVHGVSSLANLNGFSDTVGSITSFGGTIATATGELTMNGPLTQKGSPFASDRLFIEGNLRLPSGFRQFDVEASHPSQLNDVVISAKVHGPASLQKTGGGTLWLTGANDYTGLTLISEGTLVAGAIGALGTTSSGTLVADGATLSLSSLGGTLAERILLHGAGVGGTNGALNVQSTLSVTLRNPTPSIFACLDLVTNATIRVGTSARLTADGFIGGIGPLTKTGSGLLIFTNANSNTYSGDTIVAEGLLELRKPNGARAMSGNLILGPAPPGGTAVVRLYQNTGLPANAIVTANAGGLLDLNGTNHVIAGLNLNDGGRVQTGAGELIFGASAFVRVGSLSQAGSFVGSSISGNLKLSPNRTIGFDVRAFASSASVTAPELDVPASITVDPREDPDLGRAGLNKTGTGRMRLGGNNVHRGNTVVSDGTLEVSGTQIYSTVAVQSGARLRGAGTVGRLFVNNDATVAPGASPGTLTCSNFNAGGGRGTLEMELNGVTAGTGYDRLNVQGSVRLTGMSLNASLGFASAVGNQFTIIANDGTDAVVDTFLGLPQNAKFHASGQQFTISYTGGTGNDVVLTRLTTPPQPRLVIQRVPPDSVRLLWPTNAVGYSLQSNTNVANTNWSLTLPPPVVAGTNNIVTNTVTNLNFYRLSAP
jgi:fibronectin-binding autotransporter adhesin